MRSISAVIEVGVLAFWLGAAVIVSAAVAPAAFEVLPTRTLAGALVGRVLPVVFVSGLAAGAAIIALARRAPRRRVAGALIAASCAIAQFVITPRIDRLRTEI